MLTTIKNTPRSLPLGSCESDYTLNSEVTYMGHKGVVTGFSEGGIIHVTLENGMTAETLFWNLTIERQAVTHFTASGPMAGHPYCGQERNDRDRYIHLSCTRFLPSRRVMCPECQVMYDAAGEED